jgi:hypothetical protein
MSRLHHIVRRSLLAFALGNILVVSTGGLIAEAKPADLVGQNPTERYEGASRKLSPGYHPAIDFQTPAIFKFKQK